jgi:hypothetical protein
MGPSVAVLTFYKGQLEELMMDGSAGEAWWKKTENHMKI